MKVRIFLLCLLSAVLLTSCGEKSNPNVFEKDGYAVDLETGTITCGEDTYTFQVSGGGNSTRIEITYPNGATYWYQWSGNSGSGGWSDDYDPDRYADGSTLMDLISFRPAQEKAGSPLLGLLVILLGIFNLVTPRTAWYLSYGWRYKNAEPSDIALAFERIGGGAAVLIGIILCFV